MVKITDEGLGRLGSPCFAGAGTFFNQKGGAPHQCDLSTSKVCNGGGCLPSIAIDLLAGRPGSQLTLDGIDNITRDIIADVPSECRTIVDGTLKKRKVGSEVDIRKTATVMLRQMLTFLENR